jgi:hypothetical protein
VTVCVAALAESGRAIIAASDSMMSWGAGVTSETSLKYERLHKRWAILIAGDDIHPAEAIIRELRGHLSSYEIPTAAQVENAIRASWRTVKNQIAETNVLSAYDIDLETFVTNGRELFGDIGFADLRVALERASELSCELLVYGFNEHGKGTLLMAVHPGEPVNFSRLGFAAIGSGRDSAIASLMWEPGHQPYHDTLKATYRIAAAKFMGESALGVGKRTVITGLHVDGSIFVLSDEQAAAIRALWEKKGRPQLPKASEMAMQLTEPEWVREDGSGKEQTAPGATLDDSGLIEQ